MNKHMYVLSLVTASLLQVAIASASDGLRGQIADDSATFTAAPGENGEFKTSLDGLSGPSHVAQRDLKAMLDSAASLPSQQAARTETLSDADLGALFESGRDELLPAFHAQLDRIAQSVRGKTAVASNAPYLAECGITHLPGVRTDIRDVTDLRQACAVADFGITSADYVLADTGTLVTIASPAEARLVSLLPPAHIAVFPRDRILTSLDELFTLLPDPAAQTSSMVLITGPSRTADIEQILVRGVHGPGQVTAIVVG